MSQQKIVEDFVEGMTINEGDVIEEVTPDYDADLYAKLKMEPPAKKKVVVRAPKKEEPKPQPLVDEDDVDDEKVLKFLKKKKLVAEDFSDLNQLNKPAPPNNESENEKKERLERESLAFAIQNNLVTPDDIRSFHQDAAKDDRQIVWEEYLNKHKSSGKTEEQLQASFQKLWLETDEDPETADVREERIAEMKDAADAIRNKRHSKIGSVQNKYQDHLETESNKTKQQELAINTAKVYRKDFDDIFAAITGKETIDITNNDDVESVEFEYPAEAIEKAKKHFLNVETLSKYITNYNKSALQNDINIFLRLETEPQRISHVAKKYYSQKKEKEKLGRKELSPNEVTNTGSEEVIDTEMRERLSQFIEN